MARSDDGEVAEPFPSDDASVLHRILLAVVLVGIVGLGAELVLLEHWESALQWLPLGALAVGLVASLWAWVRPTRRAIRTFQVVMVLFVALGLAGLWLHYRDNMLFELEMDPAVEGLSLVRRTLFGATPFLAPGALAQTGLVGLAAAFRHPALRRIRTPQP